MSQKALQSLLWRTVLALVAGLLLLPSSRAQPAPNAGPSPAAASADQIADFFGRAGDEIYENCIFELSQEQLEVQQALVEAYIKQGANSAVARRLAVKQIHAPKVSEKCEQIRGLSTAAPPSPVLAPWKSKVLAAPAPKPAPETPAVAVALAGKQGLPQWDCAPGVDYVTIHHNGYERKLTGGEICNPFEDVVHEVPASVLKLRLGYTIKTGRLFVVSGDPQVNGKSIAWAISGRDVCRNNPEPECLAARAVGPLPPGDYSFASDKDQRVSWGPKTKRMVAATYLKKLWNKNLYTPQQTVAILARGNIAIHMRLKGEMSEACIGMGPKGWAYVAALIKDGRATGLSVYVDEPDPQIAEQPPIVTESQFSLTSLFK